ncbi:hypothetical protein UA08_04003 [Talaromyces atroroseus]|uniref:Uncharacterized protein n=1 Tax=Talaromyces atroroseus TaxID=1441469 RepID=A0A1Q5Q8E8_TALAT|nr:hypothetical protein UA08_04003 [Talaromyces atroroseus]OKL60406.1 hypothetical protein UA08_04003 [Talaromyces atroroseus]
MGSVLYNNFSEGPAMILSPSRNHPSFQFPSQSMQGLQAFDSGSWSMDAACANPFKAPTRHSSSWTPASSSAKPLFTNPSRKRSRMDSEDDDMPSSKFSVVPPVPSVEAPVYGEGMALLNPRTGLAVSAESQTGTWYEEQAQMRTTKAASSSNKSQHVQDTSNRDGPSRKSQRLDTSAPGIDDVELAWIRHQMQSTTNDDNRRKNNPFNTADEPRVDDVTLLLGISWQRVNRDGDMAPAVSGWEKYINNHFSRYLRNARIILKNRSLNAYLVAALPAHDIIPQDTVPGYMNNSTMPSIYQFDPSSYFFLFKEDLTEGQLVASTLDNCLQNLRSTPVQFEGTDILRASDRSPERVLAPERNDQVNSLVGNGIPVASISKEDHAVINGGKTSLSNGMVMSMGTDMDIDL